MALQKVQNGIGAVYYVDVTNLPADAQGRIGTRQRFELVAPTSSASNVTESTYSVTASSAEALAANSSRVGGYLQNISDEDINISYGGTASSTTTVLQANGGTISLIIDGVNCYTGAINAICASGSKNLVCVEVESA